MWPGPSSLFLFCGGAVSLLSLLCCLGVAPDAHAAGRREDGSLLPTVPDGSYLICYVPPDFLPKSPSCWDQLPGLNLVIACFRITAPAIEGAQLRLAGCRHNGRTYVAAYAREPPIHPKMPQANPAVGAATTSTAPSGTTIGPYRLGSTLGVGTFGKVRCTQCIS